MKITPKKTLSNTYVQILFDESGSMYNHAKALSVVWEQLQADFKATKKPTFVSVASFSNDTVTWHMNRVSVDKLDSTFDFSPSGSTPLFQAGIEALKAASIAALNTEDRYITTLVTDGVATDGYNQPGFEKALRAALKLDNFTVTAMVPDMTSANTLAGMGIPTNNIRVWDTSGDFEKEAGAVLRTSYNAYLNSSDKKVSGFFDVKLTDNKIQKIKDNLTDVSKQFKTLSVEKEGDISSFVESKGIPYHRGMAYYELSKAETVQPSKQILLRRKGFKKVYAGDEARKILNMPTNLTVKVAPANLQDWKMFIQSTSTNRKLVRGTEVLVKVK